MRSALPLLLMTPMALSSGRASCGKGLPVAGLGQGVVLGLVGGLCVSGLCVGGSCWAATPWELDGSLLTCWPCCSCCPAAALLPSM